MTGFSKKDEVGLGFYKREEWQRLLETAVDRDILEDTYDEWLAVFTAETRAGFIAEKLRTEGGEAL